MFKILKKIKENGSEIFIIWQFWSKVSLRLWLPEAYVELLHQDLLIVKGTVHPKTEIQSVKFRSPQNISGASQQNRAAAFS